MSYAGSAYARTGYAKGARIVASSGGTSYTLNVASAAIAVAANAVGLSAGRRVAPASASVIVGAQAVRFTVGYGVSVTTAPVAVTAAAVTLTAARRLALGTAGIVVAAPSIGLAIGRRVAPATASIALAASAVVVQWGRRVAPASSAILVVANNVTLTGPQPAVFVLPDEPVWLVFDSVATELAFDPVATTLIFLEPSGAEIMGPLQIRQYDLGPVSFVLLDVNGNPVDLTNASSVRWTVRKPGKTPIIDKQLLTIATPRTSGRVSYTRQAGDVATAGAYDAEAVVYWNDGTETAYPTLGAAQVIIEPALRATP